MRVDEIVAEIRKLEACPHAEAYPERGPAWAYFDVCDLCAQKVIGKVLSCTPDDRKPHGPGFPCPCNDGSVCLEATCSCGGVCHGHGMCGHTSICHCAGCHCGNCDAAIRRFLKHLRQSEE